MAKFKPPNPKIKEPISAPAPHSKASTLQIGWPSIDLGNYTPIDLKTFPSAEQQEQRRYKNEFWGISPSFRKSLIDAQKHIFLIDSFIFKVENTTNKQCFYDAFEEAFGVTSAKNIKILSSAKEGFDDQLKKLNELQNKKRGTPPNQTDFTIECRHKKAGHLLLPHDRFAIIDDELWHWGSNVGGTHHEVNAFSRGWSAAETGAITFFEELWTMADRM